MDFNNLDDAMQYCLMFEQCDGIAYSHKYWGGINSKGFHNGYGY